eukprot:gene11185-4005_t
MFAGGENQLAVQKYNEFLTEYQNSINISDEKREEYVKKYGRLTLPTEELGMDAIAKENYLLQYAMTYPKDYVRLRNEEISKIHNEVNEEYIKVFEKYSTGENKLTNTECKEVAMTSARTLQGIRLAQLEKKYPAKFENTAYEKIINLQRAQKYLDNVGETE